MKSNPQSTQAAGLDQAVPVSAMEGGWALQGAKKSGNKEDDEGQPAQALSVAHTQSIFSQADIPEVLQSIEETIVEWNNENPNVQFDMGDVDDAIMVQLVEKRWTFSRMTPFKLWDDQTGKQICTRDESNQRRQQAVVFKYAI